MSCRAFQAHLAAAPADEVLARPGLEHLIACTDCRMVLLTLGVADRAAGASADVPDTGECLSGETIGGFLDGTLGPPARGPVADHVGSCTRCLDALLSFAEDLRSVATGEPPVKAPPPLEASSVALCEPDLAGPQAPRQERTSPRPWRSALIIPLAAAAMSGLVMVGLGVRDLVATRVPAPVASGDAALRGAPSRAITLLAPTGEVPSTGPLRFAWLVAASDSDEGNRYRVLVSDLESGSTVLDVEVEGSDLILEPGEAARLREGIRYHWMVVPLGETRGEPSEVAGFILR